MIIVDKILQKRETENNPIKVGIIGAGVMSKGLINQITLHTPGMIVAAVYNKTVENAKLAIQEYGSKDYKVVESATQMSAAIKSKKTALTNDIDVLVECADLDVLVELTSDIRFALKSILKAFDAGKHVVTFSAELEATFGPHLRAKAAENNVLYTLGDGDQPGVVQNLFRQVISMGFEPLVYIDVKGLQDHYRNPSTLKGFAEHWGITPEMVTSFADGTKISFEQAVTANANGMCVAQRGMIGPVFKGHVDEMTSGFYPDVDHLGGFDPWEVSYTLGDFPFLFI